MTEFDVAIVATILHGIVLLLGYISYTNFHSSIKLLVSKSLRVAFLMVHLCMPTLLLCSLVSCWMCMIYGQHGLGIFFLVFPVSIAFLTMLVYLCSNLEERGPSNHEIIHGSKHEFYNAYVSHVDFANEVIQRAHEYQEQHPEHELEYSPYLQRRLAAASSGGAEFIPAVGS